MFLKIEYAEQIEAMVLTNKMKFTSVADILAAEDKMMITAALRAKYV